MVIDWLISHLFSFFNKLKNINISESHALPNVMLQTVDFRTRDTLFQSVFLSLKERVRRWDVPHHTWWMALSTPSPSVIIEWSLLWGKLEKSKWEEPVFKWKVPLETDIIWCIWVCQYQVCYLANSQDHNNLLKSISNMVECSGSLLKVDLGSWEDYKNRLYSAQFKDIKRK